MVDRLEPGVNYDNGKIMGGEENIVTTKSGVRAFCNRACAELPILY